MALRKKKGRKNHKLFLLSTLSPKFLNLENKNVINAEGITAPNILGQYGIEFTGIGLVKGNYYARPYGIYNGVIYYGDIVAFEVK